ncbi:MAG TPA: acyl-CoA dehydrogenase [Gaiellaceae bacterium]|nr:acyl-CoA dehydrogenase [Gaiellaceae bacterium]
MDVLRLDAEATEWQARARRFVEEEIYPVEQRIAGRGTIEADEVRELRELARAEGFSHYNLPRELGCADLPLLTQVAIEEQAGRATNGLGFVVADRGPRELVELATDDQLERWLRPVLRRETVEAWAVTEPGAGSDVGGIAATATRDGDEWVLDGEKWFVTGGDHAGLFVVLAQAEGEQALLLVARDAPGLEIVRRPHFMHDPYIDGHVELRLTGCRVPDRDRLPSGDDGARRWFTVERLMIAARCCGAASRLLELATEWAAEREAFGHPIAEYQGVSFPLADSLTELLAARLLTYHAAHELDANPSPSVAHGKVAMAKLYASETANRIADRVLQVFGGRGYMTEHPVERHFRELRVDRIWEGTSEIQRVIISRGLFKRGVETYLD